jgi:hypothetical protein
MNTILALRRGAWRWSLGMAIACSSWAVSAAPGLLIIRVDAVQLDSSLRESNSGFALGSFTLEEVKTKKGTSFQQPRRVEAIELEEGFYCLDHISVSRNNSFNFCETPHIRVLAGRITNAGLWRYGVERDLSTARRTRAFQFSADVAKLAATDFPELLKKYQDKEDHLLDFVARPHDQWSQAERQALRDFYERMPKDNSPPLPLQGVAAVVTAVKGFAKPGEALIAKFHVTVDSKGDVVDTEVLESSSTEATQAGIDAAKALKFVPAVCGGKPCRMEFPVYLVFR